MMHAIYGRREPCDDDTLPGPVRLQAREHKGDPARAAADPIAPLRFDRLAADLDHRTPVVIHPNHAGERVRAVLSLGIATSAIIGLTWIYTVSAPLVEPAATDVGSGNPESSSGRLAAGMSLFRLNARDEEQPWTDTARPHGVVQKGAAAYAECGPEGDVPLLGPW